MPRRRFGQHFLRDRKVIAAMIEQIAPQPQEHIIEIGAGEGVLTFALLEAGARVSAVEIDRDLVAKLRQKAVANLHIIEGDILRQDLSQLLGDLRVVGNLPYNISTPLLIRLSQTQTPEMWLMVQKEVAERAAAAVGSSAYGRLSVSLQHSHRVEMKMRVGAGAFSPPPQVESAVICIRRISISSPPQFFDAVVNAAFQSRRKMIGNGLGAFSLDWQRVGIEPTRRPQTLSANDFVTLALAVEESHRLSEAGRS